eukprot:TRINITY_DN27159_c0_g1_i1.p1 TRINITY_DN27159_c0_g1~~TRINITY_DN27159_c0_g1_i1.p1  ORF type:complete len:241 (-),score=25.95 TRINITY_DN27159_c0_g1_i1:78-740(-)
MLAAFDEMTHPNHEVQSQPIIKPKHRLRSQQQNLPSAPEIDLTLRPATSHIRKIAEAKPAVVAEGVPLPVSVLASKKLFQESSSIEISGHKVKPRPSSASKAQRQAKESITPIMASSNKVFTPSKSSYVPPLIFPVTSTKRPSTSGKHGPGDLAPPTTPVQRPRPSTAGTSKSDNLNMKPLHSKEQIKPHRRPGLRKIGRMSYSVARPEEESALELGIGI